MFNNWFRKKKNKDYIGRTIVVPDCNNINPDYITPPVKIHSFDDIVLISNIKKGFIHNGVIENNEKVETYHMNKIEKEEKLDSILDNFDDFDDSEKEYEVNSELQEFSNSVPVFLNLEDEKEYNSIEGNNNKIKKVRLADGSYHYAEVLDD